jgi:hypothetical protein
MCKEWERESTKSFATFRNTVEKIKMQKPQKEFPKFSLLFISS